MTKAESAAKAHGAEVAGVKIAKVNVAVLAESLKQAGLTGKKYEGLTIGQQVEALAAHYAKGRKDDELIECDICCGASPEEGFPKCPFCGDDPPSDRELAEPVTKVTKKAKGEAALDAATTEIVTRTTAVPKAVKTSADLSVIRVLEGGLTEATLNEVTQQILELKGNLAANYWRTGKAIASVFDTELWKMRSKENGKPAYASFAQYAANEIRIQLSTAYMLMDTAKKFSEDQARQLGMSKLGLVLRAPEAEQAHLLKKAEEGATKREIKEGVRIAKEKHGMTKRETGRKVTPEGEPGRKAKKYTEVKAGKMTVAMVEGTVRIAMHRKPLTKGEEPHVAKRVADMPQCEEVMDNGIVRTYLVVQNTQGELLLRITTRRREE